MEKRGFKEGVELRTSSVPPPFGTLDADYLNDRQQVTKTVGSMSRDRQVDQKRWSYYLNHETTFTSGFYLRTDIRRVSDPWYFRDFSSSNYYLNNYSATGVNPFRRIAFLADESLGSLNSTVRLTKNWSRIHLTALASYTDDFSAPTNDGTLQLYPAVNLTGFRQPLFGSPLQLEFGAAYYNFYRREGQKGQLWDLNPTLYLPVRLGPYLQATPWVGFRGSIWDRTDSEASTEDRYVTREIFPAGGTLSSEISRVFAVGVGSAVWKRSGIRSDRISTTRTFPKSFRITFRTSRGDRGSEHSDLGTHQHARFPNEGSGWKCQLPPDDAPPAGSELRRH